MFNINSVTFEFKKRERFFLRSKRTALSPAQLLLLLPPWLLWSGLFVLFCVLECSFLVSCFLYLPPDPGELRWPASLVRCSYSPSSKDMLHARAATSLFAHLLPLLPPPSVLWPPVSPPAPWPLARHRGGTWNVFIVGCMINLIHIYTYTCTHLYIFTCTYTQSTHIHTHQCTPTCVCTHTNIHTFTSLPVLSFNDWHLPSSPLASVF